MPEASQVDMKILVVDDDMGAQRLLKRGFDRKSKTFNIRFVPTFASSATATYNLLESGWFHGISFDQRLPDSSEGSVHSEHGMQLVHRTATERKTAFAAVFTAYPGGGNGHRIGREQLDYIAKSPNSDGTTPEGYPQMTIPSYTRWFLERLVWEYPRKVLLEARDSAFFDWGPEIDNLVNLLERVKSGPRDEDVTQLFSGIGHLRVSVNLHLSKLFSALLAATGEKPPRLPQIANAADVEKNLNILWGKLQGTSIGDSLCQAFSIPTKTPFSEYYTEHSSFLRILRNELEHNEKSVMTIDDLSVAFPSFIRLMDMVRFVCTRKVVYQPTVFRDGFLSFKDLSKRGYSPTTEVAYSLETPNFSSTETTYLLLQSGSSIVDISSEFSAMRDERNRPVLSISD